MKFYTNRIQNTNQTSFKNHNPRIQQKFINKKINYINKHLNSNNNRFIKKSQGNNINLNKNNQSDLPKFKIQRNKQRSVQRLNRRKIVNKFYTNQQNKIVEVKNEQRNQNQQNKNVFKSRNYKTQNMGRRVSKYQRKIGEQQQRQEQRKQRGQQQQQRKQQQQQQQQQQKKQQQQQQVNRLNKAIKVSGLSLSISNQDIYELFSPIGPLLKSCINYDSLGKSKGTATIKYKNLQDARTAIKKFNHSELDNHRLTLHFINSNIKNKNIFKTKNT